MTTTPERVADEREDGAERDDAPAGSDPALAVRGLSKTFGDGEAAVRAVDDVSLDVESGTVVGVLGPNGAGKTTLIKSILGLVVADEGDVRVAGADVYDDPRPAYGRVGAMLEGARNVYWRLTVRENLEYFAAIGGESPSAVGDRHDALLEQLSLAGKADETVNDLSRGQKQKVSLACALARNVEVAFLDEPTLGLDVESSVDLRREIRRLADQEDMTIVLSSHDMDVVQEVCDRVVIMADGEVVADDPVADLVDVFRTFAYRVVVGRTAAGTDGDATLGDGTATEAVDRNADPVDEDIRERLHETYDVDEFEDRGDRTAFEVSLGDPERFYDLMDALRAADLTVYEVESVDPDLEAVFLELTDGDESDSVADAGESERAARAHRGDRA
ncbi:ABC transporter ATP-binding protein [Halosimplex litoreum]|uniref:ABC transporter ATP-binding protein n=1 Tax=Halosimplex litoreum TaxID=1198301 RepID=A0A7T3G034_9EURY|nr:ABC transporter ATP-binding protein [Halosimplex litoreum]QPV63797.1 ABC transporter ATP-binding protein [Halosimplex litoreum]